MKESTTTEPDKLQTNTSTDRYDPYDYGKKDGIGRWGAVVHIIRTTIGIGILMMPFLMRHLGYITAILLMVGLSLVYYHTVHILLSVEYELSKMLRVEHLSFVGVTDKVFTQSAIPKAKGFVYAWIYIYYGLPISNTTILIVVSTNIQKVMERFHKEVKLTYLISAIVIPYTLFCMHKRILKVLVPFSWITNFCTFLMIGIVVGFSIARPNPGTCPKNRN